MCEFIVIEVIVVLDIGNSKISMEKSLEITNYLRFRARLKICPKVKVNLLSKSFFPTLYTNMSLSTMLSIVGHSIFCELSSQILDNDSIRSEWEDPTSMNHELQFHMMLGYVPLSSMW
jgi:hypothetical protein